MSWNWIDTLADLTRQNVAFALVTVTRVQGSAPREPGAKLIVTANGELFGTIGGGHLEALVMQDAQRAIANNAPCTQSYPLGAKAGQCCGGVVDVFIDVQGLGPTLHVFGAGHVGQAIVRVLEGTRFAVHVIDERKEWLDKLPPRAMKHDEAWDRYAAQVSGGYALVMTHRHDLDEDIVFALAHKPLAYLGLIGSETKWKRFAHRLQLRGLSEATIAKIKCPIGIAHTGKAPQEVAISVAAELLSLEQQTRTVGSMTQDKIRARSERWTKL
jgi:xanthine dehydrogenase accessory factor